jgi:hypothetical protein
MFTDALTLVDDGWALFGWLDGAGCCAVVLLLAVPLLRFCCAWLLLAGGLVVWACEGVDDPLGCVAAGEFVCACEGLVEGADWLVVEFAGADWLVVEFEDGLWAAESGDGARCVEVADGCVDGVGLASELGVF